MIISGLVEPVRAEPDRPAMQEVLIERVSELLEESLSGREIRFELSPRWIPGQLLRLNPTQLKSLALVRPIDRYATVDVVAESRGERVSFQARFALELEELLPVARQRLEAGEAITPDDLERSWVAVARLENRLSNSADELVGKTVRSVHMPGQPFLETDVMNDPIVEAGDQVRMIYRREGLEIIVDGEARERGAIGDVIGFYSRETRKRYRAVVRDSQTLRWERTQ